MKVMKVKTFSDYWNGRDGYTYHGKGVAANDLADFYNAHPYIKIVSVIPRQIEIQNGGNGVAYYNIELIYLVDKRKEKLL